MILALPLVILVAIVDKAIFHGPGVLSTNTRRKGRRGIHFVQIPLLMYPDAEADSGAVWAKKDGSPG